MSGFNYSEMGFAELEELATQSTDRQIAAQARRALALRLHGKPAPAPEKRSGFWAWLFS
jgi:hypothetical protein